MPPAAGLTPADGLPAVTVLGGDGQAGTYVLRMAVRWPVRVAFGQFRAGRPVPIPAGEVMYVGSALAERGSTSLARRLVRHATRSGDRPSHVVRDELLERFAAVGLGGVGGHVDATDLLPRAEKRLHWHIDYLLDEESVDLTHVVALRSPTRLEGRLARMLADDRHTAPLAPGLGASDAAGATHLLRVEAVEAWWQAVAERIAALVAVDGPSAAR